MIVFSENNICFFSHGMVFSVAYCANDTNTYVIGRYDIAVVKGSEYNIKHTGESSGAVASCMVHGFG